MACWKKVPAERDFGYRPDVLPPTLVDKTRPIPAIVALTDPFWLSGSVLASQTVGLLRVSH